MKAIKTRNLGTETESGHMGKIRSALRNMSRFWKPALASLESAHRPYQGTNKRAKHEYQCSECNKWHLRKDVQINHIVPCGTLKSYEDVPGFLYRLFIEDVNGYSVLCTTCHKVETAKQRSEKDE